MITPEQIDEWRRALDDIRSDLDRSMRTTDFQSEVAYLDAMKGFEELDAAMGEAWVAAQRAEVLR
jgi:hypothetical protein